VTSSLNLDEVLRRIVEASVLLTHAEEGFLALLDEGSGQLYLRAVKNIAEDKIKTIRLPVEDSLVGQALSSGKPIRLKSPSQDKRTIKVSTGYLVNSVLHVPILSRGRPLGVLSVVNHISEKSFKEKDESLLLSLADYAAIALENAQLYTQAEQELSERRRAEVALRESEERYALAVQGANDGIWDWDLKTQGVYFSPRWKSLLGYEESEIKDDADEWFSRVHPDDLEHLKVALRAHIEGTTAQFENEHRIWHHDGSLRWMISRGLAVRDRSGKALRIAGSLTDITDRKYAEEKLLHDAFFDLLTGLPNRALFMDHLGLAIERAKRRKDYQFSVLFLDLDRFKDVNDSLGHTVGDELLTSVARKLEKRVRSTDTVARFGGDEFVILLDDIQDVQNAVQVADWILDEFSEPFLIKERQVYINTSIGIVHSDIGYNRADEVLRDADIAMYNAKAHGKGRHIIFLPTMREIILNRTELENDLRQAIENDELRVFYQLIVSLEDRHVVGLEALARWMHPRRGLLQPIDFIPLAEETDLIVQIDRWVLRQACIQLQEWKQQIPEASNLTISVNLSSKHITRPDICEYIESVLKTTGVDPDSLKLEITESAILDKDENTHAVLDRLKDLGLQIQIDDFGTGYSSLGYLSSFPINALKIDRSFVKEMEAENNHTKIVQAIVMLSQRLGVGVIAEGIESDNLANRLRDLGCEYGQGFYFSKPLDQESISTLLVEQLAKNSPG
jgi:diguanylate cyclase (GGDEF)-like protein/PAS domain S-box-containing protein